MGAVRKRQRQSAVERFLAAYEAVAARSEPLIGSTPDSADRALLLRRLFTRLLVLDTILKRGWRGDRYRDGLLSVEQDGLSSLLNSLNSDILPPLSLDRRSAEEIALLMAHSLFRRFRFAAGDEAASVEAAELGPELLAVLVERRTPGRHEKGSYYTPRAIVVFMVRQALICYLETTLPGESHEAIARLVEERDPSGLGDGAGALKVLRKVRVCDPACGGGAFLVGALGELAVLRERLEEPTGSPHRVKEGILRDNLRGVELDPAAVEVARLRLWLELLADWEGGDLPTMPKGTLHAGDNLLDSQGTASSPGGPDRAGYDVILMNPPYLLASRVPGHAREQFRRYSRELRSRYGFSDDLYVHFIYRALEMLRPRGVLCAITSSSFLTNATKEHLRRELLRNDLRLIAPTGPGLFDAQVYPAITLVKKATAEDRVSNEFSFLSLHRLAQEEILQPGLVDRRSAVVSTDEYRDAFGAIFFEPTEENRRIFRKLLVGRGSEVAASRQDGHRFVQLGEVAPALDSGIHSGNVRGRLFYRDAVPGKRLHRLLQGIQLVRYGVWWDHPRARYRYVDLECRADPDVRGRGRGGKPSARGEYWHFCGAIENHHVEERLLMRQTGDAPFVGYLNQGTERMYTDNTVHTLLLTARGRDLGFTYRYLLALLNSGVVARIYRALAQEEGRVLAQVKTAVTNRLPLPIPDDGEREKLEGMVEEIQGIYRLRGFPLAWDAAERVAELRSSIDRRVAAQYGL